MESSESLYVNDSQTYCVDYQVSDSACTATAFLSGVKTNKGVLAMSANVEKLNCSAESDKDNHVESIFKFAQDAGKATGFVTNTRVTHATTAGNSLESFHRPMIDFLSSSLSCLRQICVEILGKGLISP